MPGLVGGFGNYLLPIHCGSPDMAKINLGNIYSFWPLLLLQEQKAPKAKAKIEAKTNSIDKLLTLKKITLAQKRSIKGVEECIADSSTPKALQGSYSKIEVKDKKYNKFNSYLAGLFEGDGHIWLPNLNMKKKHNPRFCITFGLKNEPLANKILEIIEHGHIRYKPKENACVLIVSPVKGLKKIITLINGELRTPKIHQLHKLIDWINVNHSSNIKNKPINKGSICNNSWLAGFVDADGSFNIRHTKIENNALLPLRACEQRKKRQISCRLRIEQRMVDPITNESYFDILTKIAYFFNCNLLLRKQVATGNIYYTLTASSSKSIKIIIDYFERYPLYSSKYLDYKDWYEAARLILDKKQYANESIVKIDFLKSNMNNSRVYFNWNHLKNICLRG